MVKQSLGRTVRCFTSMVLISASANSIAENFTVQIGAFAQAAQETLQTAESYGELYGSPTDNQLTRVQVGRFANREAAIGILQSLQSAGFSDAFVTRLANDAAILPLDTKVVVNAAHRPATQKGTSGNAPIDGLGGLSSEERELAVFLDGQLRIKVEQDFYTLEQYRAKF